MVSRGEPVVEWPYQAKTCATFRDKKKAVVVTCRVRKGVEMPRLRNDRPSADLLTVATQKWPHSGGQPEPRLNASTAPPARKVSTAAPCSTPRNGLGGVVHPVGEGHNAVRYIQLRPCPTCLIDLQRASTAVLTPVPVTDPSPDIGIATAPPRSPPQSGLRRSLPHIHSACSRPVAVWVECFQPKCASIGVE